jgi:hypothetical protein
MLEMSASFAVVATILQFVLVYQRIDCKIILCLLYHCRYDNILSLTNFGVEILHLQFLVGYWVHPNRIVNFLHLAFRRSFLALFLFAAFSYWFITLIFAVVIYILGTRHPNCIGGVDFEEDSSGFADAYALSW